VDVVFLLQKNIKSPLKSESERVDMDVKHPGFVADFRSEGIFFRKNALEKRESRKTVFSKNFKVSRVYLSFFHPHRIGIPVRYFKKKKFRSWKVFLFF
jgi:hypothetical protein